MGGGICNFDIEDTGLFNDRIRVTKCSKPPMVTGFVDFSKQTRHRADLYEFWKKWKFLRRSARERHGSFLGTFWSSRRLREIFGRCVE